MKKILYILPLIFSLFSCSTTSDNGGVVIDTNILIKYTNPEGENLLNPNHSHAITVENTDLYYLVGGKRKKVYRSNLDYPKNFNISTKYDSTGDYKMQLYPNTLEDKDIATTYISFKHYSTDILKVKYRNTDNLTSATKIWYNGNLRWNINNKRPRSIKIVKRYKNN